MVHICVLTFVNAIVNVIDTYPQQPGIVPINLTSGELISATVRTIAYDIIDANSAAFTSPVCA